MDQPVTESEAQVERPTIGALFAELAADARVFAEAESARIKAYGRRAAISTGIVLGLVIAAVTLMQGAVIALLVGLILALAPAAGTPGATAIVVIGALLLGALLGWVAMKRARRIIPKRTDA